MNRFQKCLTGALCAAMVASMAGCGDTAWTHRSANAEITSGMYIGLTIDALQQAYSLEDFDVNAALKDMTLEGVNGVTWVQNTADATARRYLTIEEKFVEMGLSFTAEEEAELANYIDAYWNYAGSTYESEGCGENSFAAILTNAEKERKVFEALYGEGGVMEVPEADLRDVYEEEYVKASYITIPLLDPTTYKALEGDALEAVRDEAEELLEKIEKVADFEQAKAEYQVKDIEGAEPKAEDTSEYISKNTTSYPEALVSALSDAEAGDTGSAEDANCIYIWQKQELEDEGFEDYRFTILSEMKEDDFTTERDSWAGKLEITRNDASLKKHSPKNLELK
ncbi:MAG: hypothetical protein IKM31_05010 [Oscillospiraceae bacterium]|nr:hypothetical protein [Oscillospiraceae bacterium]